MEEKKGGDLDLKMKIKTPYELPQRKPVGRPAKAKDQREPDTPIPDMSEALADNDKIQDQGEPITSERGLPSEPASRVGQLNPVQMDLSDQSELYSIPVTEAESSSHPVPKVVIPKVRRSSRKLKGKPSVSATPIPITEEEAKSYPVLQVVVTIPVPVPGTPVPTSATLRAFMPALKRKANEDLSDEYIIKHIRSYFAKIFNTVEIQEDPDQK